jgi:hypothetical protein
VRGEEDDFEINQKKGVMKWTGLKELKVVSNGMVHIRDSEE